MGSEVPFHFFSQRSPRIHGHEANTAVQQTAALRFMLSGQVMIASAAKRSTYRTSWGYHRTGRLVSSTEAGGACSCACVSSWTWFPPCFSSLWTWIWSLDRHVHQQPATEQRTNHWSRVRLNPVKSSGHSGYNYVAKLRPWQTFAQVTLLHSWASSVKQTTNLML